MNAVLELARRHCHASRPALTLRAFVHETYGVSFQFIWDVAHGRRRASRKLIEGFRQAHARLFPTEPFPLPTPGNHPRHN